MASEHEYLCDGNHTPRQACNAILAGASESAAAEMAEVAQPAVIVEPPAVVPEAYRAESPGPIVPVEGPFGHPVEYASDSARPTSAAVDMPAPSPWAVRAWEDTAAAVGATATLAAPAAQPREASSDRNPARGHAVRLAGVGAVMLAFLMLMWRRRS